MSEFQIISLTGLGLYLLMLIGMGLWSKKSESQDGFVIGSRNVGYTATFGSLSASFRDGGGIVLWVGLGVSASYGALWLIFGCILGLLIYAFVAPPLRQIAADNDFITIGEMIRHRLGNLTEKFTAAIVVVFTLANIALQLNVSGMLFAEITGLEGWIAILSIAAVISLYMFLGGYSTVIKTDTIQFFIILSVIFVPLFLTPAKSDILNVSTLFSDTLDNRIAFFLVGFCYVLSSSDSWQRVFSARNENVVRFAFPLAGLFLLIMSLGLIWVGMGAKNNLGDVEQSQALFEIFRQQALPVYILAFMGIAIMSITMSTLDTMCYLFTASVAKNFMPPEFTDTRTKYVRLSQVVIIMVLVSMSVIALTIHDAVDFLFKAASLVFILVPTYVFTAAGWLKKSKRLDMLVSISLLASVACYIAMSIRGDFDTLFILQMVPVALSTILHLICVWAYPSLIDADHA